MKILFITPNNPLLTHDGSHQRTHHIYNSLSSIATVDILLIRRENINDIYTDKIENLIGDIRFDENDNSLIPYSEIKKLSNWRKKNISHTKYDLVVSRRLAPICKIGGFNIGKVILDYDDPDHLYTNINTNSSRTNIINKSISHIRRILKNKIIRNKLSKCKHIWYISNQDMLQTPIKVIGSVLPNIPFGIGHDCNNTVSESKIIMTVGLMTYEPNIKGINHFLTNIWPSIKKKEPTSVFRIVGKHHKTDLKKWQKLDGVEVLGFVKSLEPLYSACQFTVAPIYFGGGTNIKVLESLNRCKTCVVTPFSYYGFEHDLIDGKSIYLAKNDLEMISKCIALLQNPDDCQRVAIAGKNIVTKKYSVSNFTSIIQKTISSIKQ